MKTLDFVIENYQEQCIDGRDIARLVQFVPEERFHEMGLELKEEHKGTHQHTPFTRENILKQLEKDIAFGFEKAHNERGISSSLMFEVVKMWNWILEEGLEDFDNYYAYGIPLFNATAQKYGFPIPADKRW